MIDEARRECAKTGLTLGADAGLVHAWFAGLQADWLKPEERSTDVRATTAQKPTRHSGLSSMNYSAGVKRRWNIRLRTPAQSIGPLLDTAKDVLGEVGRVLHARRIHLDWCALYTIGRMNREVWTPCPDCEEARVAAEAPKPRRRQMPPANSLEALLWGCRLSRAGSLAARCKAERGDASKAPLAVATDYANFAQRVSAVISFILWAPQVGKSRSAAAILQAILPGLRPLRLAPA